MSATRSSASLYSKSFKEGISSLIEEIKLAVQWSRPSILVVVHKGSVGQEKARAKLKKEIEVLKKKVQKIEANKKNLDLIEAILRSPDRTNTIFFIEGIGRNNESDRREIYRTLNFHRELIVENRIILVLWLALTESTEIAHFAPDFWAFRHRVVEFAPDRSSGNKKA